MLFKIFSDIYITVLHRSRTTRFEPRKKKKIRRSENRPLFDAFQPESEVKEDQSIFKYNYGKNNLQLYLMYQFYLLRVKMKTYADINI